MPKSAPRPRAGASAIWAAPTAPTSTATASPPHANRLGPGKWPLRAHDIIRCGNVTLVVDSIRELRNGDSEAGSENMLVEATASRTWEDALSGLAFDRHRSPRPGEQLLA